SAIWAGEPRAHRRRMRIIILTVLAACAGATQDPQSQDASGPMPPDAGRQVDAAQMPDAGMATTSRLLPSPPRQQWENADGFCGEMSIQSIALYNGAWISEQVVRTVAGGELLLGVNEQRALSALHFDYTEWNSNAPQPQATNFLAWMKTQLQQGVPVIYAVYLTDRNNDPDYDHIVPAIGIDAMTFGDYVATDRLTSNNNFDAQIVTSLGSLSATRQGCGKDLAHGGCVPRNVDYGVAVSGITDMQHVTLPVTMTVAGSSS